MTDNDQHILKSIGFLAMNYPNIDLNDGNLQAYLTILRDLPGGDVQRAVEYLAGQPRPFFPSAGEIRSAVFDLQEQAQDVPTAYEAWQQVKAYYQGRSVDWHPLTASAFDTLGGHAAFGQSNISDEPSWRARFISAYDVLLKREQDNVRMLPQVKDHVARLRAENVDREIKRLFSGMSDPDVLE